MAVIDLKEIGISGAPLASPDTTGFHFAGAVSDRYLPELHGPNGIKLMARVLRREPAAYTVQHAFLLAAGQAEWTVTAPDGAANPTVDFLKSCIDDMSDSWWNMIQFALGSQAFGFADMEIVYKRRLGEQPKGKLPSSKYDDSLVGIRKMAPRRQETVTWRFDDNGGPKEMLQMDPNTGELRQPIPIDKLVHFQSGADRGGWEGIGWLEPAYQLAHRISNYEMMLAIGHQRSHVGLPVFSYITPPSAEVRKGIESMARGLVVNTHQFVTYPATVVDFKLVTVTNNNAGELRELISQSRWEIMSLCLLQFLRLGNTSSGSRALAEPLVNLFINSVNSALNEVAEVLNRHLIPRLLAANPSLAVKGEAMPKFTHTGVKHLPQEILRYLAVIKDFLLTADPQDEDWLRTLTGLPALSTLTDESLKMKEKMRDMLLAQAEAKLVGTQAATENVKNGGQVQINKNGEAKVNTGLKNGDQGGKAARTSATKAAKAKV